MPKKSTTVIRSVNPDQEVNPGPTQDPAYAHPAEKRSGLIPMAFQVTSPFDKTKALLPHSLVLHVNPNSFGETFTKKAEKFQTLGGYVEQLWGDELDEISCDGSTGAFVNLYTGLTSVLRQRTIAWDRFRDLKDLFHNNGSVIDPFGNIVLQGNVMVLYDRGVYIGYFRTFDVDETEETPFSFKLSWAFKVQETLLKLPGLVPRDYGVEPFLSRPTGSEFTVPRNVGVPVPNFQFGAVGIPTTQEQQAVATQPTQTEDPLVTKFREDLQREQAHRDAHQEEARKHETDLRTLDPTLPYEDDPTSFARGRGVNTIAQETLFPNGSPTQSRAEKKGLTQQKK